MAEKLRKIGFSKLTTLEESLKKLFSHLKETGIEEHEVSDSLNRILAEDITSTMDIPPFDRSAMDGYALKAEDTFGASQRSPKKVNLVGIVEIGESTNLRLNNGEAIRISTGAPVPEGADAVIKIEDTEIENNDVTIYAPIVPGKNVAKAGEDIKKGTKILSRGIELKAEHIALLSSSGNEKVKVKAKPRVSVFASGDELLEVGTPLVPGKIYNSNTPMIMSLVKLYGGHVVKGMTVKDNKVSLINTLKNASKDSDVIIFTGGTSVGTKDYLPEIMSEEGVVLIHGIAMRPGSPVLIGLHDTTIVFCLPGTPVAAYVCFLSITGIAIRKMMGCSKIDPRTEIIAKINKDVPVSSMGYLNFLRVQLETMENIFLAHPVKLKGSGVISSLTQSDGVVEIPPSQEGLKKGDSIIVKLFPK